MISDTEVAYERNNSHNTRAYLRSFQVLRMVAPKKEEHSVGGAFSLGGAMHTLSSWEKFKKKQDAVAS